LLRFRLRQREVPGACVALRRYDMPDRTDNHDAYAHNRVTVVLLKSMTAQEFADLIKSRIAPTPSAFHSRPIETVAPPPIL
jgi:hypothetical protein